MSHEITTSHIVTPMDLLSLAMQQSDVSIEKMDKLLNLQIRWEENEARKAYHKAVADFKTESISIIKDKQVGYNNNKGQFVGYSHATLGNIVQTIIPVMSKHGLSHYWDVNQDKEITVTCHLMHAMGHKTSVTMTAGKDDSGQKNLIQQVASTVTYLQRYTLLSITGLAAQDQDDDGNGGDRPPSSSKPKVEQPKEKAPVNDGKLVSEAQAKMLYAKLKNKGINPESFCAHYKIDKVQDLPFSEMNPALKLIDSGEITEVAASEPVKSAPLPELCADCGAELVDGKCNNPDCLPY